MNTVLHCNHVAGLQKYKPDHEVIQPAEIKILKDVSTAYLRDVILNVLHQHTEYCYPLYGPKYDNGVTNQGNPSSGAEKDCMNKNASGSRPKCTESRCKNKNAAGPRPIGTGNRCRNENANGRGRRISQTPAQNEATSVSPSVTQTEVPVPSTINVKGTQISSKISPAGPINSSICTLSPLPITTTEATTSNPSGTAVPSIDTQTGIITFNRPPILQYTITRPLSPDSSKQRFHDMIKYIPFLKGGSDQLPKCELCCHQNQSDKPTNDLTKCNISCTTGRTGNNTWGPDNSINKDKRDDLEPKEADAQRKSQEFMKKPHSSENSSVLAELNTSNTAETTNTAAVDTDSTLEKDTPDDKERDEQHIQSPPQPSYNTHPGGRVTSVVYDNPLFRR